jgi:hypothetical protein
VRIESKVDRLAEKVGAIDDRLDRTISRGDALVSQARGIKRLSLAALGAVAASVLVLVSSWIKSRLHL